MGLWTMYRIEKDMGIAEFAVSRAIEELSNKKVCFSQKDIAEHIGCSEPTVNRTCRRLLRAGSIRMIHQSGKVFRYEYIKDARLEVANA